MIKAPTWNMSLALATVDGHSAGTNFEKVVTEHRSYAGIVAGVQLLGLGLRG